MTTPARGRGRPPKVTTQHGRTVQGAPLDLRDPPAGLEETARQWLCDNFTNGTGHDGKPRKMLSGFKTALVRAGVTNIDLSKHHGFYNDESFAHAHWIRPGFGGRSTQDANKRSAYTRNPFLRDRSKGKGIEDSSAMAELRARTHASLDKEEVLFATIPDKKVNLLEYLKRMYRREFLPPEPVPPDQVSEQVRKDALELTELKQALIWHPAEAKRPQGAGALGPGSRDAA